MTELESPVNVQIFEVEEGMPPNEKFKVSFN